MTRLKKRWWVLVLLVSALVLLGIPAWELYPFFAPTSSSVKLDLVGQNAVIAFKLADSDKAKLVALAQKLNLGWSGQDVTASLDATSAAQLKSLVPRSFGLVAASDREVTLSGTMPGLPVGVIGLTSEGTGFLPSDSVVVARIKGLQSGYQLAGKELFVFTAERGTLGVSLKDGGLGIVLASKIIDAPGLKKALSSLKNLPVNTGPGYSGVEGVAAGFSEMTTGGVSVYTLSQPGLAYQPTFGVLGGYLVVASSPEVWQSAKAAFESGSNMAASPRYREAVSKTPSFSAGSLYLDLRRIAGRGTKILSDVSPLFKLDLAGEWLGSGLAGDKLISLSASWIGAGDGHPLSRVVVRLLSE